MNNQLKISSYEEAYQLSEKLAKAKGFLPQCFQENPGAILMALITGQELGFSAGGSLRALFAISTSKGTTIGIYADAMLALLVNRGYKFEWLTLSETAACIQLSQEGRKPFEFKFDMDDARQAGLAGRDMWTKYPISMLKARAISNAARSYAPEVVHGIYTKEELDDMENVEKVISAKDSEVSGNDALLSALDIKDSLMADDKEKEFDALENSGNEVIEYEEITDDFIQLNDMLQEAIDKNSLALCADLISKNTTITESEKQSLRDKYKQRKIDID